VPPTVLIHVTGDILLPDGNGPKSGTITLELNIPGSILDGASNMKIGGRKTFPIADGGAVDFFISPNADILVGGAADKTFYWADIRMVDPATGLVAFPREQWVIPDTPTSQDIGSIPVTGVAAGPVIGIGILIGTLAERPSDASLYPGWTFWEVRSPSAGWRQWVSIQDSSGTSDWMRTGVQLNA